MPKEPDSEELLGFHLERVKRAKGRQRDLCITWTPKALPVPAPPKKLRSKDELKSYVARYYDSLSTAHDEGSEDDDEPVACDIIAGRVRVVPPWLAV